MLEHQSIGASLLCVCLAVLERSDALTQSKCCCVSNDNCNALSTGVWSVRTYGCAMDNTIFATGSNNPAGDVVVHIAVVVAYSCMDPLDTYYQQPMWYHESMGFTRLSQGKCDCIDLLDPYYQHILHVTSMIIWIPDLYYQPVLHVTSIIVWIQALYTSIWIHRIHTANKIISYRSTRSILRIQVYPQWIHKKNMID